MGNEESLVGFPVKQVVPALVSDHKIMSRVDAWQNHDLKVILLFVYQNSEMYMSRIVFF